MQKSYDFSLFHKEIVLGWGYLTKLPDFLQKISSKKPFIVTDKGLVATGLPMHVTTLLNNSGYNSTVFDQISSDPSIKDVENSALAYVDAACDSIIGLGGGSAIDAAKATAVKVVHEGPLSNLLGIENADKIRNPLPPVIAIPTTAGTGSEVSRGAIITDSANQKKNILRAGAPDVALVDPELMVSMPPYLTATTGMDAFTHAVEALFSSKSHPIADGIAYEAIRLISNNLIKAYDDGDNRDARTNMAVASTLAALTFPKGLGIAHSMSQALHPRYPIHHGEACSIFLPDVMKFNKECVATKLSIIAYFMKASPYSPEDAITATINLCKKLSLPMNLRHLGIKKEDLPILSETAFNDWSTQTNPRKCSTDDLFKLYSRLI